MKCEREDKRKELASELGFANIGGVFLILAIGLVLSIFVAALEFTIKIRKRKGRQASVRREMARYFRFALTNARSPKRRISEFTEDVSSRLDRTEKHY